MSCERVECPFCYENRRARANHKGHREYRPPRVAWAPPFWEKVREMKKRAKDQGQGKGTPAKGLMADYPLLWAMLTDDQYDDGSKRRRSTLLLMCDGPVAKVLLLDKDLNEQAWFAEESFDACFAAAEESLTTGAVVWQPARQNQSPRNR